MVRKTGLEPARRKTLDPKSSASANSATSAFGTRVECEIYYITIKCFLSTLFFNFYDLNIFASKPIFLNKLSILSAPTVLPATKGIFAQTFASSKAS